MRYLPFLLLFVGGVILTLGDIVMKKWVISNSVWVFVLGLSVYLIGLIFLAYSFKYKNIAVASTIFVIFNVVTLSLVSWFWFNEKLTMFQFIGIFLGLISIVFLEIE